MVPTSEYVVNQSPTYTMIVEQSKSTKNRIDKLKFTSDTEQKKQNNPFLSTCINIGQSWPPVHPPNLSAGRAQARVATTTDTGDGRVHGMCEELFVGVLTRKRAAKQ